MWRGPGGVCLPFTFLRKNPRRNAGWGKLQPLFLPDALNVQGGLQRGGVWTAGANLSVTSQCPQDEVSTLWGLQSQNNQVLAHLCNLTSFFKLPRPTHFPAPPFCL